MTIENSISRITTWVSTQGGQTGLEWAINEITSNNLVQMSKQAKHDFIQKLVLLASKYDTVRHAGHTIGSQMRCLARALRHEHFRAA